MVFKWASIKSSFACLFFERVSLILWSVSGNSTWKFNSTVTQFISALPWIYVAATLKKKDRRWHAIKRSKAVDRYDTIDHMWSGKFCSFCDIFSERCSSLWGTSLNLHLLHWFRIRGLPGLPLAAEPLCFLTWR